MLALSLRPAPPWESPCRLTRGHIPQCSWCGVQQGVGAAGTLILGRVDHENGFGCAQKYMGSAKKPWCPRGGDPREKVKNHLCNPPAHTHTHTELNTARGQPHGSLMGATARGGGQRRARARSAGGQEELFAHGLMLIRFYK